MFPGNLKSFCPECLVSTGSLPEPPHSLEFLFQEGIITTRIKLSGGELWGSPGHPGEEEGSPRQGPPGQAPREQGSPALSWEGLL